MSNAIAEDGFSEQLQEANSQLSQLGARIAIPQRSRIDGVVEQADDVVDGTDQAEDSDFAPAVHGILDYAVDNVKANCGVLLDLLDDLSKVHPFISVAALAFKTAIKLEMTRRENDRRVLALHAEMCNMMSVIAILQDFPKGDPALNETIELRMSSRMKRIADDIKSCAAKCDNFQNKPVIVRLLTSSKWEDTLGAFAVVFSSHKEDLHKDLVLLTASEVKAASITLDVVHEKVTKADLHFELLRSPEERQLLEFIERRGGAQKVSGDEGLRQELDMLIERIGADREDRLISRVANLWEEVGDNLQITFTGLFHQNQDSFERKFQLGLSRFEDVLVTAIRQVSHDRTAGSYYSEITDADIRQLWQDMGWHAREEADMVVLDLLKFSMEHVQTPLGARSPESTMVSFHLEREDAWASKYLSSSWKQGLLEAIDKDGSTKVTIPELNSFSSLRPEGWSLPRWLAYWTIGAPLASAWYYERIQGGLKEMRAAAADVLPVNRAYVQRLLGEGVFYACDCLLSGIHKRPERDFEDSSVFEKFKDFELAEEEELKVALQSVNYELDAPNTVALVIGHRRLDKAILPLLYIIVEQCLALLNDAAEKTLQRTRVFALRGSLWTLLRSSYLRIDAIKDMVASREYSDSEANKFIKNFSFGLYRYIYFNDKLGTCKYLRDQSPSHQQYFTPGSSYTLRNSDGTPMKDTLPVSPGVFHEMWTYENVLRVVMDSDHDMHAFAQLCIEQGVMMPDGEPSDAFTVMANEAVAKAGRKDEMAFEEIFQAYSPRPRRQNSLRPVRALSAEDIQRLACAYPIDQQKFFCAVVDNIVRRQVIHSPVMCDKCKKRTMNMTRLVCLGCQDSGNRMNNEPKTLKNGKTTDYCAKCLFEDLSLDCAAALLSSSYHAFLQVRQFTYNKWNHAALDVAREVSIDQSIAHASLEDSSEDEDTESTSARRTPKRPPPSCRTCGLSLELPFWFCIDCTTEKAYVCQDCNLGQEKQIHLLVLEDIWEQVKIASHGFDGPQPVAPAKHHWSHSLILVISTANRKLPSANESSRHVSILSPPTQAWSPTELGSATSIPRELTPAGIYQSSLSSFQSNMGPVMGHPMLSNPYSLGMGMFTASPMSMPTPISPEGSQRGDSLSSRTPGSSPYRQMAFPPGFVPLAITRTEIPPSQLPPNGPKSRDSQESLRMQSSRRRDSMNSYVHEDWNNGSSPPARTNRRSSSTSSWHSPIRSPPSADTFQSFGMPPTALSPPQFPTAPSIPLSPLGLPQGTPFGSLYGRPTSQGPGSMPSRSAEGVPWGIAQTGPPSLSGTVSTRPSTAAPATPAQSGPYSYGAPLPGTTPSLGPVRMHSHQPQSPMYTVPAPPQHEPVDYPPEGWIPTIDSDQRIRLPPPHELSHAPYTPGHTPLNLPPSTPHPGQAPVPPPNAIQPQPPVIPRPIYSTQPRLPRLQPPPPWISQSSATRPVPQMSGSPPSYPYSPRSTQPQLYGPPGTHQHAGYPPPSTAVPNGIPPISPPHAAPSSSAPAPQGSTSYSASNITWEFHHLNDRLTAIERSIVHRMSKRLSSRLEDHHEDLEQLLVDVKSTMERLLSSQSSPVVIPEPASPPASSDTSSGATEAHRTANVPYTAETVEELHVRISVVEERLAVLEAQSLNGLPQVTVQPPSTEDSAQDIPAQASPPTAETASVGVPTPGAPTDEGKPKKGMWRRASRVVSKRLKRSSITEPSP